MFNLKRKLAMSILSMSLIVGVSPAAHAADPAPAVFIDGERTSFDVPPMIRNGTTLVPMRKIFEELGAEIEWDGNTQTVTASKGNTVIKYTIGQPKGLKNGDELHLSVPGMIIDGATMMPLRFVGEALGATVGWEGTSRTITISSIEKTKYIVTRVVDGDTLEISDSKGHEEKLRMIGVNTPETVDPNRPVEEYGKEASDYTKKMLTDKTVYVEFDVEERDQYGRLLAYIYLEDGTMFNAKLVAEGYAQVATYPPNVRWVDLFKSAETDARENGRGLWKGSESPQPPASAQGDVKITSVDAAAEVVVISNTGSSDVNLRGWKLVSVTGNQTFNFPDYTLKAGSSVKIVSGQDASSGGCFALDNQARME